MIRAVASDGRAREFDGATTLDEMLAWQAGPPTREEQLVARVRELEGQLKARRAVDIAYGVSWTLLVVVWWLR